MESANQCIVLCERTYGIYRRVDHETRRDRDGCIEEMDKGGWRGPATIIGEYCRQRDVHVSDLGTAAEMWKKFRMVKESSSRLAARKKLHRTFAKEGDDLAEHIIEVTSARKELHAMGVQIQARDFLEFLMASLPESWDVFTTTYVDAHDSSMKKLTPEDFISAIYKENSRRSTHSRPAMSH